MSNDVKIMAPAVRVGDVVYDAAQVPVGSRVAWGDLPPERSMEVDAKWIESRRGCALVKRLGLRICALPSAPAAEASQTPSKSCKANEGT